MSTANWVESREELAARLSPFGQGHVLRFWDELDTTGQAQLARQLAAIDLERLATLYRQGATSCDWAALARRATPPPAMRLIERTQGGGKYSASDAKARAVEALRAGKIGVLLVAGGQGSRLGFEHPKGMFPIGPVSNASLLQIHFEKALAAARRYGASMPVYMMTSPITHDEQAEFLREHNCFGLQKDDVVLF